MQRYELHKSQISDDFVYWFRNGEDISQAVFRKKSLKMSVLYWRVPYICENVPKVEKEYTMKIETEKARKLKSKILDSETFPSLLPP